MKPISAAQQHSKTQPTPSSPGTQNLGTQNLGTNLGIKALGIISLVSIIVIHWLDLPGKLSEVPYLGYAYIALMVGSALSAILIIQDNKRGWWLGGALALGSIVAYILNRTVGLPLAMDDIGNWGESLGVYSLIAEGAMLAVTGWVLSRQAAPEAILTSNAEW
jgi:MFS superfamily sulfate permease-like transporter